MKGAGVFHRGEGVRELRGSQAPSVGQSQRPAELLSQVPAALPLAQVLCVSVLGPDRRSINSRMSSTGPGACQFLALCSTPHPAQFLSNGGGWVRRRGQLSHRSVTQRSGKKRASCGLFCGGGRTAGDGDLGPAHGTSGLGSGFRGA